MTKKEKRKKEKKYIAVAIGALLLVVLFMFFSKPMSVVNVNPPSGAYTPNEIVNDVVTITVPGVTIDNDYSDGKVCYLHAKWVLYHNGKKIDELPGDPIELTTNTYSHSINRAFSEVGNYAHGVIVVKSEGTWTGSDWHWVVTEAGKETHTWTVGIPKPPTPWEKIGQIISNFINMILSWFGL